jgi:hypothetical protein
MLRYVTEKGVVTVTHRNLLNGELHNLYFSSNTIKVLQSVGMMRWRGHAWHRDDTYIDYSCSDNRNRYTKSELLGQWRFICGLMIPCRLKDGYQSSRGTCRLHIQHWRWRQYTLVTTYQATRCQTLEDYNKNGHCCFLTVCIVRRAKTSLVTQVCTFHLNTSVYLLTWGFQSR